MGVTRRKRITKKGRTRRYRNNIRSMKHRGGNKDNTVDLVVARYKEKLEWLKDYKGKGFRHVYIYNKGEDNIQCPDMGKGTSCKVIKLTNVGVCDNTYLRHIVDHYDNAKEPFANVTIFCPGSTDLGHKRPMFNSTLDRVLETHDTVLNTMKIDTTVQDSQYNFMIGKHVTSHMNNRNDPLGSYQSPAETRPFGAWYEKHFPGKKVQNLSVIGIFAASRKDILANPKSLYEELLRQVNTEKFHEAAHFMERAWSTIIDNPERCYEINESGIRGAVIAQIPHTKKKGGRRDKKQRGGGLKFAVMAIFKNEAMGIREWIEHYKWQGVDEILLLDNNSTDNWKEKIKGLEDNVTVIHAPRNHVQAENYVNLGLPWLKEHGVQVLGILDLDEYMFGTDGKNLKKHVEQIFGAADRPSQFSCRWTMFGSSGHDKQPESIRKSFTWRKKELDFNIKSVVWLNDIVDLTGGLPNDIHVYYKGVNQHRCNVSGRTDQCPSGIQINHYAIQSKEFFEKVKMTRGAVETPINVRDWAYFERYDHKEEEDTKLKDLVK